MSYIHPDDISFYKEKMKEITSKDGDYSISYRIFNGSSYYYIKEDGARISSGKSVELCGIMKVVDNYRFEKTDTILDNIQTEPEMLARLNTLINLQQPFLAIHFELTSIPEINDKYGRAIGNLMINDYVDFIKTKFVNDNQIYRISGLEFVAFITDLRKMDILKNNLANNDKMLHVPAKYMNDTITTDVHMGIAYSTDSPNPKDVVNNATKALKFSKNKQVKANHIYYREI
jgi:GGDEF domain-containing protein